MEEAQRYAVIVPGERPTFTWVEGLDQLEKAVGLHEASYRDALHRDGGASAAAAIAQMAAKYQEGKKLAALFQDLHSEIANLIENAVQRIMAYIDQVIEKHDIETSQALIDACGILLVEWENNPKEDYRIEWAIVRSMEAIKTMQIYGWRQMEAVADGQSFRLLTLAVAAKHDPKEKKNVIAFYNDSIACLKTYVESGRRYFQSLIDNIGPIWHGDCHTTGGPGDYGEPVTRCKYSYTDNGVENSLDNQLSADRITQLRNAAIAAREAQRDRWIKWANEQLSIRQTEWAKLLP